MVSPEGLDAVVWQADLVITMGCGDQCPYIPGKSYIDWDSPTPPEINDRGPRDPR